MTIKALGCHIFAGGFSCGVRQAGVEVLGHCETSDFGVTTAKANLNIPISIGPSSWQSFARQFERVDWLYGNPPCASWSNAGVLKAGSNEAKWKTDERTDCTRQLFKLGFDLGVDAITWESVQAAWFKGREFSLHMAEQCLDRGYDVNVLLFDGIDVGACQRRARMMFCATKFKMSPQLIPDEFGHPTVKDVLDEAGLWPGDEYGDGPEDCVPGMIEPLWEHSQPGDKFRNVYNRLYPEPEIRNGKAVGRPGFMWCRLHPDEVMRTMTAQVTTMHPYYKRGLTIKEQSALASYPPEWQHLASTRSKKSANIAQGVLPAAGRWTAQQVAQCLEDQREFDIPQITVYDWTRTPHSPVIEELA